MTSTTPTPPADIAALDRLVGTWKVSGDSEGTVTYEWMEGGHFLLQHVDLTSADDHNVGLEVIGHVRRFGEEPSRDIHSRFYGSKGESLDYVYELEGDVLTIWGGSGAPPPTTGAPSAPTATPAPAPGCGRAAATTPP